MSEERRQSVCPTVTPPEVVERHPNGADALITFICQELENWGFRPHYPPTGSGRAMAAVVDAGRRSFFVHVHERMERT
jgi:hypothetical protein